MGCPDGMSVGHVAGIHGIYKESATRINGWPIGKTIRLDTGSLRNCQLNSLAAFTTCAAVMPK